MTIQRIDRYAALPLLGYASVHMLLAFLLILPFHRACFCDVA